jgi:hypothetical protein
MKRNNHESNWLGVRKYEVDAKSTLSSRLVDCEWFNSVHILALQTWFAAGGGSFANPRQLTAKILLPLILLLRMMWKAEKKPERSCCISLFLSSSK